MMTKTLSPLRPAGAAIAAVLALSSTAVLAQDTSATMPVPLAAPSITPTNAPVAAPQPSAPPSADILRSATTAVPVNPNGMSAPAPASVATRPTLPAVEPVPQTRRAPAPRPVAAAPVTPRSPSRPAPLAIAPVAQPAVPVSNLPLAAPAIPAPLDEPVIDSLPVEQDVVTATPPVEGDGSLAEWALIGGLVGIGGIAAAAALARRRRPEPQPDPFTMTGTGEGSVPPVATTPSPLPRPDAQARSLGSLGVAAPVAPVTVLRAPVYANRRSESARAATPLGRHEAMVDAGPTPDNPFLTRRKRLTRARFLDRQEATAQQASIAGWHDAPTRYAAMR